MKFAALIIFPTSRIRRRVQRLSFMAEPMPSSDLERSKDRKLAFRRA